MNQHVTYHKVIPQQFQGLLLPDWTCSKKVNDNYFPIHHLECWSVHRLSSTKSGKDVGVQHHHYSISDFEKAVVWRHLGTNHHDSLQYLYTFIILELRLYFLGASWSYCSHHFPSLWEPEQLSHSWANIFSHLSAGPTRPDHTGTHQLERKRNLDLNQSFCWSKPGS